MNALSQTTSPNDTIHANRKMDGLRHVLLDQIERRIEGLNRTPKILEWMRDVENLRPNTFGRLLKLCDDKPELFPHEFKKTLLWEFIPAALNLLDARKDQPWGKTETHFLEVMRGNKSIMSTADLMWLNNILTHRDEKTAESKSPSVTALSVMHPKGN